ncbi:hypothetical protein [Paraburkholderia solisilvae]|uniref:hypothetical protein n=1 Tax=Paraburkholderia solisilvae TaxID=624376 RepID=UPI001582DEDC|nr:hypothetical protein [Paraburkholderia solisilvae]
MSLDDLFVHPLFTEVIQDNIAVQEARGLKPTDLLDGTATLDEHQFYVMRVGFSLSHTLAGSSSLIRRSIS